MEGYPSGSDIRLREGDGVTSGSAASAAAFAVALGAAATVAASAVVATSTSTASAAVLRLKFLGSRIADFLHFPFVADGFPREWMIEVHPDLIAYLFDDALHSESFGCHHGEDGAYRHFFGKFAVAHEYFRIEFQKIIIAPLAERSFGRECGLEFIACGKILERSHESWNNLMADAIDHNIGSFLRSLEEHLSCGIVVKLVGIGHEFTGADFFFF